MVRFLGDLKTPKFPFEINWPLALLEKKHAPQHLPKLWTDLVESEFSKAPLMAKMELIVKIGKAMKRFGDNGDDVLCKTMGRISEGMYVF